MSGVDFDTVEVKGLRCRTQVGFSVHEIGKLQALEVSVQVSIGSIACVSDSPDDCFNVRTLAKDILAHVEGNSFKLIETVAENVGFMAIVLLNAAHVRVEVRKPHAIRFAEYSSVVINRSTGTYPRNRKPFTYYIAAGSNIDPRANVRKALQSLCTYPHMVVKGVSSVYQTTPVHNAPTRGTGGTDNRCDTDADTHPEATSDVVKDDDFLNFAVKIESVLYPAAIKAHLLNTERRLGRVRDAKNKNAPRPIDLDIALWNGTDYPVTYRLGNKGWSLPAKGDTEFAHVMIPLAELAPEFVHCDAGVHASKGGLKKESTTSSSKGVTLSEIAEQLAGTGCLETGFPKIDCGLSEVLGGDDQGPNRPCIFKRVPDVISKEDGTELSPSAGEVKGEENDRAVHQSETSDHMTENVESIGDPEGKLKGLSLAVQSSPNTHINAHANSLALASTQLHEYEQEEDSDGAHAHTQREHDNTAAHSPRVRPLATPGTQAEAAVSTQHVTTGRGAQIDYRCDTGRKVAIVTGGTSKIGRRITKTLHAAGYDVCIHVNSSVLDAQALANQLNACPRRAKSAIVIVKDFGSDTFATQAAEMIKEVVERLGRLDLLVNSAAMFKKTLVPVLAPPVPILADKKADIDADTDGETESDSEQSSTADDIKNKHLQANAQTSTTAATANMPVCGEEDYQTVEVLKHWHETMNLNVVAPFFLARAAAPELTRTRGSVINIADIHGTRPLKEHSVYCVSKAAIIMVTKALAQELAPHVRVNAVSPGAISWTDDPVLHSTANQYVILSKVPMKRLGDAVDIADTVLYLSAGEYTTGVVIPVDGGRSLQQ
ncbi:hypothetical protein SARC_06563 [Sphaeroforma arctica JP610]|uniref:2-amino-4-hydroxy-6-hydroxymethyldihydropteridine diphosphokinase n=1 Tax=Sphaeroforma arctica JP610 TaxID=667725 RepID=A0A0L0FWB2_9EUKA|nr:hypothetical protein SARC_06563 [Sphaeroforma arctica JP610]KNC81102.1 hypothetical protein SARC_06563 [Sphaeroforma arctica JP610]|eukprot:XP_014155004.1 hypothetical protein SARC_06563 [Sphaeroforma arctica JP610]